MSQQYRQEARERGIKWAVVLAIYTELKAEERGKRERPNEVRAAAWTMHTASVPGCWPFWRHGFLSRFGRRIAKGADHTVVAGYDEIAQQIGTWFPEYADDDGTERLWDFLLSPYDKMPPAEELYRKAIDRAELIEADKTTSTSTSTVTSTPF